MTGLTTIPIHRNDALSKAKMDEALETVTGRDAETHAGNLFWVNQLRSS